MITNVEGRHLIELPPELIKALGEVAVRHGQIEYLLTMTICRTTELSYDEAFEKAEKLGHRSREDVRKRAKQKFDAWAMREFGETDGKERSQKFSGLIQAWMGLCGRRDDVIHCCWSVGIEDNRISGTRRGKLLKNGDRPYEIEDVERLGDNLKQFVIHLNGATMPGTPSGPADAIAALPTNFSPDYRMPTGIDTTATVASRTTLTSVFVEPFDD